MDPDYSNQDKREHESNIDCLDVLSDEMNREILKEIAKADKALSAGEISERCEIPKSTVYRKIKSLIKTSILEEKTELRINGKHTNKYTLETREVRVKITELGLDVTISKNKAIAPS